MPIDPYCSACNDSSSARGCPAHAAEFPPYQPPSPPEIALQLAEQLRLSRVLSQRMRKGVVNVPLSMAAIDYLLSLFPKTAIAAEPLALLDGEPGPASPLS